MGSHEVWKVSLRIVGSYRGGTWHSSHGGPTEVPVQDPCPLCVPAILTVTHIKVGYMDPRSSMSAVGVEYS